MRTLGMLLAAWMVIPAGATAGCVGSVPHPVRGKDRVALPSGRVRLEVEPRGGPSILDLGREPPEPGRNGPPPADSAPRGSLIMAVEVEGAGAAARSTRDFHGHDVEIGTTRFPNPGRLRQDYRVWDGSAVFVMGQQSSAGFRVEGHAGLLLRSFSATIEGVPFGPRESEVWTQAGPLAGLKLSFRPIEGLTLYGRGRLSLLFLGSDYGNHAGVEAGLRLDPAPGLGLFLAYAARNYVISPVYTDESAIFLHLSGPALGVEVVF